MPTDFSASYELSRGRFTECVKDLNNAQLNFRIHPGVLTIGEMALHLAGVEIWFVNQMRGQEIPEKWMKVRISATEGVVNDNPFPFSTEEITADLVREALELGDRLVRTIIFEPTESELAVEMKSALGPIITGKGALARMAFHPAYHHGQAYLIRQSPNFPA